MDQRVNDDVLGLLSKDFSSVIMEQLFYWVRDRVASLVAQTRSPDASQIDAIVKRPVLGAFVCFKKHGRLRSCMGCMTERIPLISALDSAAYSASKKDPRFPPITSDEFYDLDLEIWILGSKREVEESGKKRCECIEIGRDGVQIQGRGRRGLLLPSIALEMCWNAEKLLEAVCEKAGLARGAWKDDDVQLFTFEGISFKKPFVWNVSKNNELAALVMERQQQVLATSRLQAKKTIYSLSPDLFRWQTLGGEASSDTKDEYSRKSREPAVAGLFYPKTTLEQNALLDRLDSENVIDQANRGIKKRLLRRSFLMPVGSIQVR